MHQGDGVFAQVPPMSESESGCEPWWRESSTSLQLDFGHADGALTAPALSPERAEGLCSYENAMHVVS